MLRQYIPRPMKRLARRLLSLVMDKGDREDKDDWEFRWQESEWLKLWETPEVQSKCLDYWKEFRHYDDIRGLVVIDETSRVLDVGCGLSSVLHWLPGRRTGIDPLGDRYCEIWNFPFEVVKAPGEAIPFSDAEADVVFCSNCIDHVTDPVQVLEEIGRVMKPDARFILTCEVFTSDEGARNAGHPYTMTEEKLFELAEPFEIVESWNSPWYGMRNYVLGGPPTDQREHILLLKKR